MDSPGESPRSPIPSSAIPWAGSPEGEVRDPEQQRIATLVSSMVPFLDPSVARALQLTSTGYEAEMTESLADRVLDKRRVEAKLGYPVFAPMNHNWKLTYELLNSVPVALYFTGNDVDKWIANKEQLVIPPNTPDGMRWLIGMTGDAIRLGQIHTFQVLTRYLVSQNHFPRQLWVPAITTILQTDQWAFLELPEVVAQLDTLTAPEIINDLEQASSRGASPRTLDLYLTYVYTGLLTPELFGKLLSKTIIGRRVAYLRVFLKHNLIDFINLYPKGHVRNEFFDNEPILWNPIWLACKYGYPEIVSLFLDDPDVQALEKLPFNLSTPIINGDFGVIKLLVGSGKTAPVPQNLNIAAQFDRTEIFRLLLQDPSLDPSTGSGDALRIAINDDRTEIALMLLADPRTIVPLDLKQHLMATAKYNDNEAIQRALRLHG